MRTHAGVFETLEYIADRLDACIKRGVPTEVLDEFEALETLVAQAQAELRLGSRVAA